MNAIKINVNKQLDGYVFTLLPRFRETIRQAFPGAHPANTIFVAYDTGSDFESHYNQLQQVIFPALLGVTEKSDFKKIGEIQFVDTQTGTVLHKLSPAA